MHYFIIVLGVAVTISAKAVQRRSVCDQLPWLAHAGNDPSINIPGLVVNGRPVDGSDCSATVGSQPPSPLPDPASPPPPPAASPPPPPAVSPSPPPAVSPAPPPATSPASSTPNEAGTSPPRPAILLAANAAPVKAAATPANTTTTGACRPGMKNIIFNGEPSIPAFDQITAAEQWITCGFDIQGLDKMSARVREKHIPMMPQAKHVAGAVELISGPNPPEWLLTFNEPDVSYMGVTPLMGPEEAAEAIKPLLAAAVGRPTKYVAPVSADPTSDWLTRFYASCNCRDFFSAYNLHIYTPDAQAGREELAKFHTRFPDKPIWITEVAPGPAHCSVGWDAAGTFMHSIYAYATSVGYVDKVFWNSGNQIPANDENVCNSYLVGFDGTPSPLFATYQAEDCHSA